MKHIWLIDDDADDREVFAMALSAIGLQVGLYFSHNGEEALKAATAGDFGLPDYIFLDLNMPKLGGLGFLKELRARGLYQGIPVFIYTTSSRGPDIDQCVALGGKLMTKHSSFDELCNDLRKHLL
jgi:CheY-like chemotaxis protein